ncbi:MAG: SDR family oxidoreductase [Myxococcota bacterium]
MKPTALITGASAGIGVELARLFAADGYDLLLVARRKDRLESLAAELQAKHQNRVHVLAADLMDPGAPAAVVAEVERLGLQVEALVNNAGFGTNGPFQALDPVRELGQVQLNVTAVVALSRAFLPKMVERKRGYLLNLGSTAGFQPGPWMATYYATKAFVNSFSEALHHELRGTGVSVTVCCPGPVATEFAAVAGNAESRLFQAGAMTAAAVAESAYRAMKRGQALIVPGLRNKLIPISVRFSPRGMVRAVAAALNRSHETKLLGGGA